MEDNHNPSLEELILSLQKSVAKASEITSAVSKYDTGFLLGDRTIYNIKELDFELKAKLDDGSESESIKVDLNANPEDCSVIRFKIQPQVFEKLEGPQIIVSKYRSLSSDKNRNIVKGMVWVINEFDIPEPNYPFKVFLAPGGLKARRKSFSNLNTDISGKLKFTINTSEKTIQFQGQKAAQTFSFSKELDWYMWASIELSDSENIEDGVNDSLDELKSELIQIYYPQNE